MVGAEIDSVPAGNNSTTADVSNYQYIHAEVIGGRGYGSTGGDGGVTAHYLDVGGIDTLQLVSGADSDESRRTALSNALGSGGDGGSGGSTADNGNAGGNASGVTDDDTGTHLVISGGGGGRGGSGTEDDSGGGGGGGFPGGTGGNGPFGGGQDGEDAASLDSPVSDVGGDGGDGGEESGVPSRRTGGPGDDGDAWADGGYVVYDASVEDSSVGVRLYEVDEEFWEDAELPENVTAEQGARGEIALSWDAVDEADEYTIYEDGSQVATTSSTS